jgi:hypothetical protein
MLYEVSSKRTIIDKNGRDKVLTEHFVVSNCMLFAEAETAILTANINCDVVAVSRSAITGFINKRMDDEQKIFLSSIEIADDFDASKTTKEVVALFAKDVAEATKISLDYMAKSVCNETLIGVKKSKFLDVIKYLA